MDVRLPDGTIVQNVPDGMTRTDLAAKLKAGGMNVPDEWLAPPRASLGGAADIALTAAGNALPAVGNAISDIATRATGNGPSAPLAPWAHLSPEGQATAQAAANSAPGQAISQAAQWAGNKINSDDSFRGDLVRNGLSVMGDFAQVAGAGALGKAAAGGVGSAVDAATAAGRSDIGMVPQQGSGVAKFLADESAKPAAVIHNQAVGDAVAAREAGLSDLSLNGGREAVDAAREPAAAVYGRLGRMLPAQAAGPGASAQIDSAVASLGTASDAAKKQVADIAEQLKQPMTGVQQVNKLRDLRQEGFRRLASEDVDQQLIGRAQIQMAKALEGQVERSIPPNADVSIDQFRDARRSMAKNFAIAESMKGKHVDLQALARAYRADPNELTGGTELIAKFADANPETTGIAKEFSPPGVASDLKGALKLTKPVGSTVQALGGSLGRRMLTGDTKLALRAVDKAFPARSPSRFGALAPGPLLMQPPPGTVGITPQQGSLGPLPQGRPRGAPPPLLQETPGAAYEPYQPNLF